MARFFIDRPILAWVIAIVVTLAGALAVFTLPMEQYPDIAPPSVRVNATYPGASAKTVEQSVTQVIEQQMTGIDHLMYMSSESSSQGTAQITLSFEAGTDPDIAQVQVQNKVQQAMTTLPAEVQAQGIKVTKSTNGFLMVVGFYSPHNGLSATAIGDYLESTLVDPISRIDGVGTVRVLGTQYAMRIWLDPDKLDHYKLMPSDVAAAIRAQNTQIAAGELGGLPAVKGQQITATITARSKLQTPAQFRAIVIKSEPDGSTVTVGDVARVELGAENYNFAGHADGHPAAGIAVSLASGANAVATAAAIKKKIAQLAPTLPPGLTYVYNVDTSTYVKASIHEVVKTLGEAIVLVVLIMYLFMQNLRATLIPAIAVPVVLLGTFGVLALAGYSINTLTMFGVVLAIGLLVDDAIVVVENVERIMQEEGLSPRDATRKSMEQITSALFGIALVLAAVFVPMAFFGGSTGIIYRQFSVTMVSAMALSVTVAIVLSPALCATLLRPVKPDEYAHRRGFFGWFNRGFERGVHRYRDTVGRVVRRGGRMLAIYALLIGVAALLFWRLPTSFVPEEDQGVVMAQVQLPPGATQQRTLSALSHLEHYAEAQKGLVKSVFTVAGFSFSGSAQNSGMGFIHLVDWGQRPRADQSAMAFARRADHALSHLRDARIFVINPPPIRGLGTSSGFDLELQDVGGIGHDALVRARDKVIELANRDPVLAHVRANGLPDQPQYKIRLDERRMAALGVSAADVNSTLSSALGGEYVNDFINRNRVKKVYIQADAPFRMQPGDFKRWYVRNDADEMVPLSAVASARWTYGSPRLERYNGVPSFEIVGEAAPGYSSGDAMKAMGHIVHSLPKGVGFSWTGLSYQEQLSGQQAPALYAISLLFVFLCLAALYESWSIPFAVMLAVPLGVVGALLATKLRGLDNDVYFQVALLTTVGLAAKNAILIVEFATKLQAAGETMIDAILHAVRIRLRPILMTSLAFMCGVLPLAVSSGAGAAGRIAIGTGVLGGMLGSTILGVFFVPLFFVLIRRRSAGATREKG